MEITQLDGSVLLWGPPGSGKSTLLNAFIKELYAYSANREHNFAYRVLDGTTNASIFYENDKPPVTQDLTDRLINIQRYSKTQKYRVDYQFLHRLTIRDFKGQDTIDWSRGDNNSFHVSVDSFDKFLVILDPLAPEVNKQEASKDFVRLCERLLQYNKTNTKYLAICITKTDQLDRAEKPDLLFNNLFNNDVNAIKAMLDEQINIRFFAVSALGYYFKDGHIVPNYSEATGWLANEAKWSPKDVVKPFFWLFTKVEEDYLRNKKPINSWVSKVLKRLKYRSSYMPWLLDAEDKTVF